MCEILLEHDYFERRRGREIHNCVAGRKSKSSNCAADVEGEVSAEETDQGCEDN